nr:MAG TPA: helix-turn-helix domain protein [Caudoviricetes sp.]
MENYKLNAFTKLLSNISREEYDAIRITLEAVYEVGLERTMFAILNSVKINGKEEEHTPTKPIQSEEKVEVQPIEEEVVDTADQDTSTTPALPEVNLKQRTYIFPEDTQVFINNWKSIDKLGDRLKYFRSTLHFTQSKLALHISISTSTIVELERNHIVISPTQILKYLALFSKYDIHMLPNDFLNYSDIEKQGLTNKVIALMEGCNTTYERAKFVLSASKISRSYMLDVMKLKSLPALDNRLYGVTKFEKHELQRFIEIINGFGYLFKFEDIWVEE